MDVLLAGNDSSLSEGSRTGGDVQRLSPVENVPGQAEQHSGAARKLFGFGPDSCSPSPRNRVRLAPDSARLAALTVKNSQDTIAGALTGDYRPEHVFALKQSLKAYRYYHELIAELDAEIQRQLSDLPDSPHAEAAVPQRTKKSPYAKSRHEPAFDLRSELYRISGVDLTNVPGISAMVAHTILCEIGTGVERFRNASAFASWLGLCPEKQISGGKVLYTHTRPVRNRVAIGLRMGE